MGDGNIGRRLFLKVVGATSVAAGCSPATAPEKLIPLLIPPENMVPGKPLFYRTVCRECPAGCGVTARSREGRVVKLEGNPDDPISRGALCARGQAGVQGLYSPQRLRGPLKRAASGKLEPITWDAALAELAPALVPPIAGFRMLTRAEPGSAGEVQRAFVTALGGKPEQRVVLEPRDPAALREASRALYGKPELPVYDLEAARSVISFGADFAETWLSPVELQRGFALGRSRAGAARTRFTWVGPRLSATAAAADEWLRVPAGAELDVALLLLRWLVDPASGVPALAPEAPALFATLAAFDAAAASRRSGVAPVQVAQLGRELAERRPSALLGPGAFTESGEKLAAVIELCNLALGNIGKTVLRGVDALLDFPAPPAAIATLLQQAAAGQVRALFVHHADPVGTLPAALRAGEALKKVPLIVAFGERLDATAELAHLVLPDHHWLESFGDLELRRGLFALSQPAMNELHDTRAASQILMVLGKKIGAGMPPGDFQAFARKRALARAGQLGALQGDPLTRERAFFGRGVAFAPGAPEPRPLLPHAAEALLAGAAAQKETARAGFTLVVFPTALAPADPAAPSWLREVPDPLTGVAWQGWAEISTKDAARLSISDGDVVALHASAPGAAEVRLGAVVSPFLIEGVIAVPQSAPELRALPPGASLEVRRIGPGKLARVPGAKSDEGRGLILSAAEVKREKEHEHEHGHEHRTEHGMRPPPAHPVHRWAMTIDLDKCTGCQACVVACYAENNLTVTGPEAAQIGRNLAWLRVQRSPTGEGASARMGFLPSLCQQCDRAPCEPVCPVYATYHNSEGLNTQIYNRCIGTRYCANNCPYDARVFNWSDPKFEPPLNLQLNPDVSVRSKGVMEKCTFCVQRIRSAENEAKNEERGVRDGEVVPACAQTCSAQAITFGDLKDPLSRLADSRKDERGYRLLDELGTGPAVTYLGRGGKP